MGNQKSSLSATLVISDFCAVDADARRKLRELLPKIVPCDTFHEFGILGLCRELPGRIRIVRGDTSAKVILTVEYKPQNYITADTFYYRREITDPEWQLV